MYTNNYTPQFRNFETISYNKEIQSKLPKLKLDTTKIIKIDDNLLKPKKKNLFTKFSAQKNKNSKEELQTIYGGIKKYALFIFETSSIHGLNHLTKRKRHPAEM